MSEHNCYISWPRFIVFLLIFLKVTVQFETEGNGQNEIVSNMEGSEVKLSISEKNTVISHIQNEILKQKNLTGSEFEGAPKHFFLKSVFLETIFMPKL